MFARALINLLARIYITLDTATCLWLFETGDVLLVLRSALCNHKFLFWNLLDGIAWIAYCPVKLTTVYNKHLAMQPAFTVPDLKNQQQQFIAKNNLYGIRRK